MIQSIRGEVQCHALDCGDTTNEKHSKKVEELILRVAGSSSSSIRVISSSFFEYSRNVSGIFEFIGYKIIILDMKVPFFEYSTSIFRHSS